MPELPEVETARRILERTVVGKTITRATAPRSRVLGTVPGKRVEKFLSGMRAVGATRRGKHILLELENDRGLHLHLGMSGRLVFDALGRKASLPHARLELHLDDDSTLTFRDPRMFGRVEIGAHAVLEKRLGEDLGLDPVLDPFGARELGALLAKTKRPIKIALMDQTLIAGLGNIYVAEALWRAKIHPETSARTLDPAAAKRLARAITRSLQLGLEDLQHAESVVGEVEYLQDGGENPFSVYGREGEPCARCKTTISKTVHGGRSTFYCSACQRLPGSNTRGRGTGC